ncbi:MAG: CoB--CoM heterodisulfide reductase iron-sulfur subunit D [Candidatus Bathyarchaeota archaeon BA1]|nr:MAG: CoB--CoM heterodisulfide reductase iron-sulfur subunit D [Candidatus Bathyarchaeota archaeon BA1]
MTYLERYKEDAYNCLHCRLCTFTWVFPTQPGVWPDGSFQPSCPSGEKFRFEAFFGGGRAWVARAILEGKVDLTDPELVDVLFACPTCGNCQQQCQLEEPKVGYRLRTVALIEAMRAECVKAGSGLPGKQKAFGVHVSKEHNPYMELHKDRLAWLPSDVKLPEKSETIYFVGCTSAYRQRELARATVEAFQKIGVDFTILRDEWCCTSPLLRTGQWETGWVSAKNTAQHNVAEAKEAGAKRIVTTCAGCYRVWKRDYVEEEYREILDATHDFEILHTTELLERLIKSGEIEFRNEVKSRVAYHDPCHLGRHASVYDPPRNVLKGIPGVELIEMPRNRENAWCCGSGGGVKSGYPDWAVEIAGERIREAEKLGADAIVSACPFCWRNLSDAINKYGSKLKMCDVIELVNQAI